MENSNKISGKLNGSRKYIEKVLYKGEFRLLGSVIDVNSSNRKVIGYVIMVEKSRKSKMFTVAQAKVMIHKFKFVNAVLDEKGEIECTECSINSLFEFDTNYNVIGNAGIVILGEIMINKSHYGYRIINKSGKILDINEAQLISLVGGNTSALVNAKITHNDTKTWVSAVKGEFTVIEMTDVSEMCKTKSATRLWREERFRDKLINIYIPKVIASNMKTLKPTGAYDITKLSRVISNSYELGQLKTKYLCTGSSRRVKEYIAIDRQLQACEIILNEIIKVDEIKNTYSSMVTDYIKQAIELANNNKTIKTKEFKTIVLKVNILTMYIGQYIIEMQALKSSKFNAEINKSARKQISYDDKTAFEVVLNDRSICSDFKDYLMAVTVNNADAAEEKKKKKEPTEPKVFSTNKFTTAEDIAQLGLCINPSLDGTEYITKTGHKYHLKYIFNGDYGEAIERYVDDANCVGDLLCMYYIERLLQEDMYYEVSSKYKDESENCRKTAEIILKIMAIFNGALALKYYDNNISSKTESRVSRSEIEEIAETSYSLNDNLNLYYESGFCVYLNDGLQRRYRVVSELTDYENSSIINYRELGTNYRIGHEDLSELASIINMVASDSITADYVDAVIGNLRFI